MNVGSNGITAGAGAPYLIEFGGAGGVVRAATHFASALNATLVSNGTEAITFDTQAWGITLSGNLTGDGGLNKTGTGTLTLSGAHSYSGATSVSGGVLRAGAAGAFSAASAVTVGAVVAMRWVDPPVTAFMLRDRIVAAFAGDPGYEFRHDWRALQAISRHAPLAVVAAEDQRFPFHHGFDFKQIDMVQGK